MNDKRDAAQRADDERTTAVGLARYAFEYIEAARVLDEDAAEKNPGNMISPVPAYFLAHHGIELTLKAYLRSKDVSLRQLASKTYGHDLHASYRKSKELGLLDIFSETPNDRDAMWMLVKLNERHGLRYIQTGMKSFPLWSIVDSFAVRLHQAVAPAVGYRSFDVAFAGQ
jgi:hypothetical protein